MAIVTSSITVEPADNGIGRRRRQDEMQPQEWGGCAGGVSQGGKRMAKTRRATMPYKT